MNILKKLLLHPENKSSCLNLFDVFAGVCSYQAKNLIVILPFVYMNSIFHIVTSPISVKIAGVSF